MLLKYGGEREHLRTRGEMGASRASPPRRSPSPPTPFLRVTDSSAVREGAAVPPGARPGPPSTSDPIRLVLAGLASFLVIGSWYVLRPFRDEIASVDSRELPYLWTAVFVFSGLASAAFSALVQRTPRRVFLPVTYGILAAGVVGFSQAHPHVEGEALRWLERGFYVFCSVYTLFAISVLWSTVSDLVKHRTAKWAYGPIFAFGTLGQVAASEAVSAYESQLAVQEWLWIAAGLLFGSALLLLALDARARRLDEGGEADTIDQLGRSEEAVGGTLREGLGAVVSSSYLRGVAGYLLIGTFIGSLLYYQQSQLLERVIEDRGERRVWLGNINKWVGIWTLIVQAGVVGVLLRRLGPGPTLCVLPAICLIGFSYLAFTQASGVEAALILSAFGFVRIAQRTAAYAVSKPAKELLFTLVTREQKYKAKNFIDTAVYRGGDTLSIWTVDGLKWLFGALFTGGGMAVALSIAPLPVLAGWMALGLGLGREARRRSDIAN
jgi:AAA family ATP:ADP antiporter